MRIVAIISLLLVAGFATVSFTANKLLTDVWKQLGMTEQQAKEDISQSFLSGYFHYYGAKEIKNIVTGDRAALASSILAYTKEYVSSPVFQAEYNRMRAGEKAKINPVRPAITREELVKNKVADAEKNIATFENLLKTTTDASAIKSYKEQLEFWKNAAMDYKSPNSTQIAYEIQMDASRYKTDNEAYNQLLKKWESNYPESPAQFIRQRLVDFVAATKDIDYKAALVDKNNKKFFVNPVYEKKNWKWKMGFRAGKETTETTRAFAESWIREIQ